MGFKITAVVITWNEEENIKKCLNALDRVADEIIVVDCFSTDNTPTIAKSFEKVVLVQQEWKGFSEQKNTGIRMAKNPFILSVDGDEILSDRLIASIIEAKKSGTHSAYSLDILTYFRNHPIRHCGWYPGTKVRLWDSRMAIWEGAVHETLKFNEKVAVCHLKGDINHFSIPDLDTFIQKISSYSQIFANDGVKRGKEVSVARVVLGPLYTFIRMYFLKLGILDGLAGFQVCSCMAFLNFVKYSKLRALNKQG